MLSAYTSEAVSSWIDSNTTSTAKRGTAQRMPSKMAVGVRDRPCNGLIDRNFPTNRPSPPNSKAVSTEKRTNVVLGFSGKGICHRCKVTIIRWGQNLCRRCKDQDQVSSNMWHLLFMTWQALRACLLSITCPLHDMAPYLCWSALPIFHDIRWRRFGSLNNVSLKLLNHILLQVLHGRNANGGESFR